MDAGWLIFNLVVHPYAVGFLFENFLKFAQIEKIQKVCKTFVYIINVSDL